MCLAIPGCLIEIYVDRGVHMGRVDFDGMTKRVCLEHVPDAKVGEYVLVHVGFALAKLDEREARETLALLRELGGIEDELGTEETT